MSRVLLTLAILLQIAEAFAQEAQPFPSFELLPAIHGSNSATYTAANAIEYSSAEPFRVHNVAQVIIQSGQRIHIKGNFRATDLVQNGRFHARIEQGPFDVAILSPSTPSTGIYKNQKLEVGIRPEEQIMNRINAFIDYSNTHTDPIQIESTFIPGTYQHQGWQSNNGINPFLEWEIKVKAEFVAMTQGWDEVLEANDVDAFYFVDCPRVYNANGLSAPQK